MKKALILLITITFAAFINPMLIDKKNRDRKIEEKKIISDREELLLINSAEDGDFKFINTSYNEVGMYEFSHE